MMLACESDPKFTLLPGNSHRNRRAVGQFTIDGDSPTMFDSLNPNVTTRARVVEAIHITCGSSPFNTATSSAPRPLSILAFSARVFSSEPKEQLCSVPIEVTTTTFGHSAFRCIAICPGPVIPTSRTHHLQPGRQHNKFANALAP
jgi:hypothetical protein